MLAYLQIFADKEELLDPFDDAERGRLLTAMLSYALHDVEIELTGNERYVWPVFRQMINQSRKALASKSAAGSRKQQDTAQTSKPVQEPAPDCTPQQPETAQQEAFTPPTVDEVRTYAAANGLTLDAELFVDHYASNGWMVGKAPMNDWQSSVRNWCRRDKSPPGRSPRRTSAKALRDQQYTQREYNDTAAAQLGAMMAEYHGETQ